MNLETAFVRDFASELVEKRELGQVNFRVNSSTWLPSDRFPDEDSAVVVVQLEMNSPTWITKQIDAKFPNHFQLYVVTNEFRHGLQFRPSGQRELDGGYLLVGAERGYPVMIECFDRPGGLPTRCQLWQRRQYGVTVSVHFNGSRLPEWRLILQNVNAFLSKKIISIEARAEV